MVKRKRRHEAARREVTTIEITKLVHSHFKDYYEFMCSNGYHYFIYKETGVYVRGVYVNGRWYPEDAIVCKTQRQIETQAAYREKMQRRSEQRNALGPYIYTLLTENTFCDLPPDTLARTAYLASYLRFGTNELWRTERSQMKSTDLQNVMRMSERATRDFWGNVKDRFFYRDKSGFLHTTGDSFIMGKLESSPMVEYQKLYKASIQELYQKIPLKQHKKLGFALKMLPYLNFEYNVLCYNPTEKIYTDICPMTVSDFCGFIGFDKARASSLAREYGRLTFTVDNVQEVFCKFLSNGRDNTTATIYLNPHLVYKGTDFRKVAAIGISFAASAKTAH